MDEWIVGLLEKNQTEPYFIHMEYTKRRNLNRGYMKLEVWQRAMDLFGLTYEPAPQIHDFKLRSQFLDAVQSTSANVSEGYGRRTLPEYLNFLHIAKGSLGESLTRAAGLWRAKIFNQQDFERFDSLHYEVENKLLSLIASLEAKSKTQDWSAVIPSRTKITTQQSINPTIH